MPFNALMKHIILTAAHKILGTGADCEGLEGGKSQTTQDWQKKKRVDAQEPGVGEASVADCMVPCDHETGTPDPVVWHWIQCFGLGVQLFAQQLFAFCKELVNIFEGPSSFWVLTSFCNWDWGAHLVDLRIP
jgi:hypothetical protein